LWIADRFLLRPVSERFYPASVDVSFGDPGGSLTGLLVWGGVAIAISIGLALMTRSRVAAMLVLTACLILGSLAAAVFIYSRFFAFDLTDDSVSLIYVLPRTAVQVPLDSIRDVAIEADAERTTTGAAIMRYRLRLRTTEGDSVSIWTTDRARVVQARTLVMDGASR
jgi:hypothetical protein